MKKVLLFDLWGTLIETGIPSPTKQVQHTLRVNIPFSSYINVMEKAMMTKKFENLHDAFIAIAQEFKIHPRQEMLEHLIGLWNKSWMLAQPYQDTEEMLAQFQKKYSLVLVSNTDCFSAPKVLEKYNLNKYFEKIFFSYELGLIKTDEQFMKTVLKQLDTDINNCVFIGDSLQSDMAVAQRIGMKHILMDLRNGREFHPKITSLRELEQQLEQLP
jgi:HAD superfamily hydrolase (TIGR01549 family)